MLLTNRFVLLHVPKTGGTFLSQLCLAHLPSEWEAQLHPLTHAGYAHIPPEFAGLPVVLFVRNPWDWYVSWYSYAIQNPPPDGGWQWEVLLGDGNHTFKEAVAAACRPRGLAKSQGRRPLWLREMEAVGLDYYSAMHSLIAGGGIESGAIKVHRFEGLAQGFLDFLDSEDLDVPPSLRQALREEAPLNASPGRTHYREYYDDETSELVRSKAAALIDLYRYEF